jgi:hypothetical protein
MLLCNFVRSTEHYTFPNEMFLTRMGKSAKFMITGDPIKSFTNEEPFPTQRSFIGFER